VELDAPAAGSRALALARALRERPGVLDAVAGCATVTVHYDPEQLASAALGEAIARLAAPRQVKGERPGRLHAIPVVYDGPHLAQAAASLELDPNTLVRLHTAALYRVQMTARTARGSVYLAPLSGGARVPRHGAGGCHMPPGSVAVAGALTSIGRPADPEGWHLVGRTPIDVFLPDANPSTRLRPGDRVRPTAE
jgi:KipI family sensor histidine kinase inhibitor